ncbi:MAG: FAD-dependent oxidoreductase [Cytophagaceae bacterium]
MSSKTIVSNWGNYPRLECGFFEPSNQDLLCSKVDQLPSVIARGNGRCYGDSALGENIISTLKLNKILSFDLNLGIITCQAGVLLSDILEVTVPKGFFLPVTPGTKFITVGGALASDIHGKNHHSEGCFSDHVHSFDLLLSNGKVVSCSKESTPDLFWLTAGGMGLTGIILSVTFKLKPIETAYIRQESIKAKNLQEIMELFEESENWTYTVSWIDCLAKGKHIGKSIMMRGEHASRAELGKISDPLVLKKKLKLNVPIELPDFTLNSFSVNAFNFLFYNKQQKRFIKNFPGYDSFFYPLDSIDNWNRIYGKSGFTQYQFVIPKEASKEGLTKILNKIAESGEGSFLAVLKLFGKANSDAILSFPFEGYTLALDFRINKKVFALLDELDKIVFDYGGRLYLTKDVRMSPEFFEKTYGDKKQEFLAKLKKAVPDNKFNSVQSIRLGL